jgi:DNA-binding response OmpR family regulator
MLGRGGLSGWHVARQIREKEPTIPVIYLTTASAEEWAARGVPNSILIPKPFAPAQLVTAISQLLNVGSPDRT